LKHTWPSHPDYDGLKIEISKIDEDIKVLNRWKKFSESKGTIELLQNQIKRQNVNNFIHFFLFYIYFLL